MESLASFPWLRFLRSGEAEPAAPVCVWGQQGARGPRVQWDTETSRQQIEQRRLLAGGDLKGELLGGGTGDHV